MKIVKMYFWLYCLLSGVWLHAQSMERKVLANSGSTFIKDDVVIQQTIGQIAIKTLDNNINTITQGFQQPEYNIIKTFDLQPNLELIFYPNPCIDHVDYVIKNGESAIGESNLILFSINGELLNKIPLKTNGTIDFSSLASGTYLIQVEQEAKFTKSFQIIKITK